MFKIIVLKKGVEFFATEKLGTMEAVSVYNSLSEKFTADSDFDVKIIKISACAVSPEDLKEEFKKEYGLL
jgi:hypothetical protein